MTGTTKIYRGKIEGEVFYDIYYAIDLSSQSVIYRYDPVCTSEYNEMINDIKELESNGRQIDLVKVINELNKISY